MQNSEVFICTMLPSMFMSGSPGQVPHSFGPGHGAAAAAAVRPSVALLSARPSGAAWPVAVAVNAAAARSEARGTIVVPPAEGVNDDDASGE